MEEPASIEASQATTGIGTGMLAPDFTMKNLDGKEVSLKDYRGKKVMLNFWATWCPPCIAEMPSISKLYNRFKDNKNVVFLMVDVDGNTKKSTRFMEKKNYSLPVYTPASAIPSSILDGSIPTTLIVDKKGKIVFKHTGGADYGNEKLIKFLDDLAKHQTD